MLLTDAKIGDMKVDTQTKNALKAAGVGAVADLIKLTRAQVLLCGAVGRLRLARLEQELAEHGLHLANSIDPKGGDVLDSGGDSSRSSDKSLAESLIDLLCAGSTMRAAEDSLGIKRGYATRVLERRSDLHMALPIDSRTFKARRDDVLANVALWREYKEKVDTAWLEYRSKIVKFDF